MIRLNTLYTLLLWAIPLLLAGQNVNFPQQGTEIYYACNITYTQHQPPNTNYITNRQGYVHAWHQNDTLIQGKLWAKFRYQRQTKNSYSISGMELSGIENIGTVYYSNSNDTVYRMFAPTFEKQFYWHNNPQPGDVWKYIQTNPEFGNLDTTYLLVHSVSLFDINGYPSKNILVKQSDKLGNHGSFEDLLVGLDPNGFFYGYQLNSMNEFIINTVMGTNPYSFTFDYFNTNTIVESSISTSSNTVCFSSNLLPLFHVNQNFNDCLAYISLSIEDANLISEHVSYFPNPVQNQLNLYNQSSSVIYTGFITDLSGRKQGINFSLNTESTTVVSLSSLKSGMYILVLKDKDGNTQTHKFIKQ